MKLKHGYIQNTENIPAEHSGAGWIYFSEDDKAIYLDSGSGPVKFSGTEVDLSNYYTKEEVGSVIDDKLPSLEGYATEQWVEDKNYLTEHQSLDGYATEEFVSSSIPTFSDGLENTNNSISVKIDSESEAFVSVSEKGLKVSGIKEVVNSTFDNYLNTQGFTSKVMYLKESEWEELKEQVELGNKSWNNNVIYMVYSDD